MWRSVLLELWLTKVEAAERDAARLAWQQAEYEQLSDVEFAAVLGIAVNQFGHEAVLLMCKARLGRRQGVLCGLAGLRKACWRGADDRDGAAAWTLVADVLRSRWIRMVAVTGLFLVVLKAMGVD